MATDLSTTWPWPRRCYNRPLRAALPLVKQVMRWLAGPGRQSHARNRPVGPSSVCTPAGLPIALPPADPKVDQRQVLLADRPRLLITADKGHYVSDELNRFPAERGARPTEPGTARRTHHQGVSVHTAQPILALSAIWQNPATGQPIARARTAHDH
ncbi:hypothetical protein [Amycolatopsis thermophila]|uniref:Transposase n=1 Tax=Amycolatopsis thermophila TaxID=206084 RepID=A0ABU0F6P5_9PSEU|nr:hypothetical protein [Amycolatopsis thermophila]MDQ0383078.1 hypothetical protein [Amycolatopsis thermophila]